MSDTDTTETPTGPDYTLIGVGTFDRNLLGGQPADAVRRLLLARAGFGPGSAQAREIPDVRIGHDHAALGAVAVVCDPFPPDEYDGRLESLADWLSAVKKCTVSKTEVKAAIADGAEPTAPVSAPVDAPAEVAAPAPGPDLAP